MNADNTNTNRPTWLDEADAGMAKHQELGWARYLECPPIFAEGLEYSYTDESGETRRGTCTGLVIQPHNEKIRRVVIARDGNNLTRDYPRVLDVELDD